MSSSMPLPDDATVTLTMGQLRDLVEKRHSETFHGISTAEAHEITGIGERKLRRQHRQWERIQNDGQRPEIRVSRKSGGAKSDLLFDEGDCWAYYRKHGGGPSEEGDEESEESESEPTDPNDIEGITDRLLKNR